MGTENRCGLTAASRGVLPGCFLPKYFCVCQDFVAFFINEITISENNIKFILFILFYFILILCLFYGADAVLRFEGMKRGLVNTQHTQITSNTSCYIGARMSGFVQLAPVSICDISVM